ncbi:MAG: two-component system sensor histidine kinase/response regulator [Marinomonas sp.]|jgi:two-component system chemotaxis response regulator CheY|uniref:Two-component system chemotaxis response regulator CheY n=1 Tax=Marinomonas communis TaxID=28254 RepID=A0A4R6X9M2_9GAMM|nr:response regulator [Marinomonas communis]MAF16969.1 two-component system sensor histidine kinase/response regulator [Marinomonas sp.]MCC4275764.1 response regulator [Marinomonas communis]RUM53970.1 MAG: response regulator [Marinomonas sp.]TDR14739.1 two-component system chemotaxis response regulator CheY [Marinomonas communis]
MKKILLVDDSMTMLMSMEGVLKRAGFDVKTATDGNQALGLIDSYAPDLVITDLNMPGMDGIELIKKIKQNASMRFKPILMLTTESQESKKVEAKAAGATGWLVKPVSPTDLTGVIKKVLPGA